MPWARLNDGLNDDAKLNALSDSAFRLWTRGLIYCQKNLTNGFIPGAEVDHFRVDAKNKAPLVAQLCTPLVPFKGPLWHRVDGGYQMHDYLDHNDSRDKVLADRAAAEGRKKRFHDRRAGRVLAGVSNAFRNAFLEAFHVRPGTHQATRPERTSTYHVPRTEDQERSRIPSSHPVEAVETVETPHRGAIYWVRRARSSETPDGKPAVRVIAALARTVLAEAHDQEEGEQIERLKQACARANLHYSGRAVTVALAMAKAQLHKAANSHPRKEPSHG